LFITSKGVKCFQMRIVDGSPDLIDIVKRNNLKILQSCIKELRPLLYQELINLRYFQGVKFKSAFHLQEPLSKIKLTKGLKLLLDIIKIHS
jgi:hypothetical protein